MTRNFYYRTQAEIVAGAANFSALISANPINYGLTAAQATSFELLNSTLQSAWTEATTPETKTPVAVAAKNIAIRNMRAMAVPFAKLIVGTPTVDDAQLVA